MSELLYIPVTVFRPRREGGRMNDNRFALIFRDRLPIKVLTLFIVHSPLTFEHHLMNDLNLSGLILGSGLMNSTVMQWGEVRLPLTEEAIPELLRRMFQPCFINEFRLDDFFNAVVVFPTRRSELSIAAIIGKVTHISKTIH